MKAAAEQLIPLTLELGGKSPTIYIYIHDSVRDAFIEKMKAYLKTTYHDESLGKIGKIVSAHQIKNLAGYLEAASEKVIYGGNYDMETRHFEATLMDHVNWHDQVMQQEIFGPVLRL